MRINKYITWAALLALLFMKAAFASQPNIVFFFIDDMGWKDWSGGGSDYFDTPNIDRIANEGMAFPHGYVNAANCAPSRCSLLSGQYPPRNHFYSVGSIHRGNPEKDRLSLEDVPDLQDLPDERVTFAEAMKKAGYQTAMYGKWHVSNHITPAMQGFDEVYEHDAKALPGLLEQDPNDPKHIFSYTHRAMGFAEKSVLEGKPFLIYLAHHAVHVRHEARPETLEAYDNKEPGTFHNSVKPIYGAVMSDTDTSIGMMLDKLEQLDVQDNTVVIFLSDNGGPPDNGASQAPLRSWKGCYYEGGIRVPYLVRWPGKIRPGAISDTPVMAIDLYPTMLELAGVEDIERHLDGHEIDGQSILPVLLDEGEMEERALFWHFPAYLIGKSHYTGARSYPNYRAQPVSVIRRGDWKLLMYLEEWSLDGGFEKRDINNALELYNLKTDVGESDNVALRNPELRDRLLDELLKWQTSIGAPVPKAPNKKRK
jgi:arylsulfatase A-like enzyme